ncbi:MAG: hypothetical protein E7564_07835 [Ruminococcaceae bacterium]|nr:hypothetical protein [Oscillospiraceae bacterium]
MLKIHSVPTGAPETDIYSVAINGKKAKLNFARVSAFPFNTPWPGHQRPLDQTEEAAFVSFESDGEVYLKVNFCKDFAKAVVRPLSKNIEPEIDEDGSIRFSLKETGAYTLELDGSHNALHIFFNPVRDFKKEADEDKKNGRTVYYYGEGEHNIGDIDLPSHSTVIIDAGAIVYGSFSSFDTEDVKIKGYGIIDGSKEIRTTENLLLPTIYEYLNDEAKKVVSKYKNNWYFDKDKVLFDNFMKATKCLKGQIRFYFCKNIEVEGVIMRDSSTFCLIPACCDNVLIDNVKTIGMWRYNSDGIDIFNSSNIIVKNTFLRNFDDCMVIKGIVGWDKRNNENIIVENCVIWCDWGSALEIGAETNAPEYRNIIYRNCDIIHGQSSMMRIHHHNYADIHHVLYENINCEYTKYQESGIIQNSDDEVYFSKQNSGHPNLIDLPITGNKLYGRNGEKGITHDISFKNIRVYKDARVPTPNSPIGGLNEINCIKNVSIENLTINGERITSPEDAGLNIREFAYNITLK